MGQALGQVQAETPVVEQWKYSEPEAVSRCGPVQPRCSLCASALLSSRMRRTQAPAASALLASVRACSELGEGRRLLGDLGRVHVRVPPGAADLLALRRRQPAPALRQRAGGEALRQPSDLRARHHDLRGDVVVQLALVGAIRQPPREHVDLAQLRGPAARLLQLVADVLHNRLVAVPALAVLTTRRLAATPARAPRQPQAQAPTRRGLGA